MDVTLNEHERMLSEQARDFLSRESPLDLARTMEDDERGYPPISGTRLPAWAGSA